MKRIIPSGGGRSGDPLGDFDNCPPIRGLLDREGPARSIQETAPTRGRVKVNPGCSFDPHVVNEFIKAKTATCLAASRVKIRFGGCPGRIVFGVWPGSQPVPERVREEVAIHGDYDSCESGHRQGQFGFSAFHQDRRLDHGV